MGSYSIPPSPRLDLGRGGEGKDGRKMGWKRRGGERSDLPSKSPGYGPGCGVQNASLELCSVKSTEQILCLVDMTTSGLYTTISFVILHKCVFI